MTFLQKLSVFFTVGIVLSSLLFAPMTFSQQQRKPILYTNPYNADGSVACPPCATLDRWLNANIPNWRTVIEVRKVSPVGFIPYLVDQNGKEVAAAGNVKPYQKFIQNYINQSGNQKPPPQKLSSFPAAAKDGVLGVYCYLEADGVTYACYDEATDAKVVEWKKGHCTNCNEIFGLMGQRKISKITQMGSVTVQNGVVVKFAFDEEPTAPAGPLSGRPLAPPLPVSNKPPTTPQPPTRPEGLVELKKGQIFIFKDGEEPVDLYEQLMSDIQKIAPKKDFSNHIKFHKDEGGIRWVDGKICPIGLDSEACLLFDSPVLTQKQFFKDLGESIAKYRANQNHFHVIGHEINKDGDVVLKIRACVQDDCTTEKITRKQFQQFLDSQKKNDVKDNNKEEIDPTKPLSTPVLLRSKPSVTSKKSLKNGGLGSYGDYLKP